jgi:hypothetical protein
MHACNAGKIAFGGGHGTMIGESVKLNSVAYTCACSLIGVLPALVVALMGAVRAAVRVTGSSADACGRWLTKQTMRCFFWSTVRRTA